jgi:hypothetical protein
MDMKSLAAGLAMGAAASFGVAVTAAPGDAIFETVEQVEELSDAQQAALGEFVKAIFSLPVDTVHGLSCVRKEGAEGEPAKVSCAARVYKTASPAELLEQIEAGNVGRVVGTVK